MTIRDYLSSTYSRALRWFGPIIFPLYVVAIFLPFGLLVDKVLLAALFVLVAAFAAYIGWIRCPVCGKRLGKVAMKVAKGSSTAHCPHCHVSFDDPMPLELAPRWRIG